MKGFDGNFNAMPLLFMFMIWINDLNKRSIGVRSASHIIKVKIETGILNFRIRNDTLYINRWNRKDIGISNEW